MYNNLFLNTIYNPLIIITCKLQKKKFSSTIYRYITTEMSTSILSLYILYIYTYTYYDNTLHGKKFLIPILAQTPRLNKYFPSGHWKIIIMNIASTFFMAYSKYFHYK